MDPNRTEPTPTHTPANGHGKARKIDVERVTMGLALIGVGLVVWLVREGFIDPVDLSTFWPVILIVIGLSNLFCGDREGPPVLILIGTFFLLYNLGWASWPVALIGLGALFLLWGWWEGPADGTGKGASHAP